MKKRIVVALVFTFVLVRPTEWLADRICWWAMDTTVAAQVGAVPPIAFEANADFLRTPADVFVGEVGGVGRNSRGQIFVYTRTGPSVRDAGR
jgi:hypothetical protein